MDANASARHHAGSAGMSAAWYRTMTPTDERPKPETARRPMLRLLGSAEWNGDGDVALRFLPERRYRLLAYLALRGDWVSRDELAALFWPDRAQAAARSNLRKLLFEVRSLTLPSLEDAGNALRWSVEHDVAAFERLRADDDHTAALAHYRGALLTGFESGDSPAFSAWLEGERTRLRDLWRHSVMAAIRTSPAKTRVDLSQRLLDDDPYDEDALGLQMRAFVELDRREDAVLAYRTFARRVADELGLEPASDTRQLAQELQATGRPAPSRFRADPPDESTDFFGREHELAELRAWLGDDGAYRLITVSGPGGMGKSRLVKELVHPLPSSAEAPVCWIALDDIGDAAQATTRLAGELGLRSAVQQDAADVVARHLAPLRALVVFDNAEHLPVLTRQIETWLEAAPQLRIVVTSRTRLGLAQEWLLPLRGLDARAPAANDDAPFSDAARLFVKHARMAEPRFDAMANAPGIAALMRALGGMPLAILLAASWVRILPVAEMVANLNHLLDVLERAEEGEERPEHRSVRATLEQSWRLLSPAEQEMLATLSVFAGSFSRVVAMEVAQAPLPVLGSLIDKSLVQLDADARCSLHPLIQQFAAAKLAEEAQRRDLASSRHALAYARTMKAFRDFDRIDQAKALRTIATELANVLVAWEWAIRERRADVLLDCCAGLSNHFQARGPIRTGVDLLARAEAAVAGDSTSDAAWSLALELASLHYWLGEYPQVVAAGRRALAQTRARRHGLGIRSSLNTVGLALSQLGRFEEADRYLSEALKRARAEQPPIDVALFAGNLVGIKRYLGNDEAALALAHEAMDGHRARGHRIGELSMANEIGQMQHELGRIDEAIASFERGVRLASDTGLALRRVSLLTHLASACLDAGAVERAEAVCRESLQLRLESGAHSHEPTCRRTLAAIVLARGDLEEARTQLLAAIDAARRLDRRLSVAPILRDCAAYFERIGDVAMAMRCVASADAHGGASRMRLIPRHRLLGERLAGLVDGERRGAATGTGLANAPNATLETVAEVLARRPPAAPG
jgi:predicted ATPase/DNA-binding SARP family transcriptional activator